MGLLARLFGGDGAPDGSVGELDPDEYVIAHAALTGGGHLVATSHGMWVPEADGPRRVAWHLVSKASWQGGAIELVEADEAETIDGVTILADRRARRLGLGEPGRVPKVVHERVTGSIRSRHHRELPGGAAWFVQRKIAGKGAFLLQVRPDPGTDPDAVRRFAAQVAQQLPT